MPYVITTSRKVSNDIASGDRDFELVLSRVAVATLEEARAYVWTFARRGPTWRSACIAHETSDWEGGSVGPLPDGTIIEVARS